MQIYEDNADLRLTNPFHKSNTRSNLRSTNELPKGLQSFFDFKNFNQIQSESLEKTFYKNDNLVICAPTGSGKTVLLELAALRIISQFQSSNTNVKIIYISPLKALCSEKYQSWKSKFAKLSFPVTEITGDSTESEHVLLKKNSLIVTTPEKWDALTRQWYTHDQELQKIKLVLIDEVHILSEKRGATLECIVSRMKVKLPGCRYVATSATIPNWIDVSTWIGHPGPSADVLLFGDEYRPVPLQKTVMGFASNGSKNDFKFDYSLNYQLADLIDKYSDGRPTLVFCSTRKASMQAAEYLSSVRVGANASMNRPLKDKKLRDLVCKGVAFHHAGLAIEDRNATEQAFLSGKIQVLFSTSTLAVGVNLPAHLVIIKSTKRYIDRGYEEYSDLEILQMMGRAGRPQFDTLGKVLILTEEENVAKYESLVGGTNPIESTLHENLVEFINAEIAIGTLKTLSNARTWLQSTFLYVRLRTNSKKYFSLDAAVDVDGFFNTLLNETVAKLQAHSLIVSYGSSGGFRSTNFGSSMAKFYVKFESMCCFVDLVEMYRRMQCIEAATFTFQAVLKCVSCAAEFGQVKFQQGEKRFLNEFAASKSVYTGKLKYALPGDAGKKLKETWTKVYLLLQVFLGDVDVHDSHQNSMWNSNIMNMELGWIVAQSIRILKCFISCLSKLYEENPQSFSSGMVGLLLCLVKLITFLKGECWPDLVNVLKQVDKLGKVSVAALASANITTFEGLLHTDPRRIEMLLGRNAPFGNQIIAYLNKLPWFYVRTDTVKAVADSKPELLQSDSPISTDELFISIGLLNEAKVAVRDKSGTIPVYVFVRAIMDNVDILLIYSKFALSEFQHPKELKVSLTQKYASDYKVVVNIIPENVSGMQVDAEYIVKGTGVDLSSPRMASGNFFSYNEPLGTAALCSHKCLDKQKCKHDCCKRGNEAVAERMVEKVNTGTLDSYVQTKQVKIGNVSSSELEHSVGLSATQTCSEQKLLHRSPSLQLLSNEEDLFEDSFNDSTLPIINVVPDEPDKNLVPDEPDKIICADHPESSALADGKAGEHSLRDEHASVTNTVSFGPRISIPKRSRPEFVSKPLSISHNVTNVDDSVPSEEDISFASNLEKQYIDCVSLRKSSRQMSEFKSYIEKFKSKYEQFTELPQSKHSKKAPLSVDQAFKPSDLSPSNVNRTATKHTNNILRNFL